MRLTLRTLLAYLDDTLEPAQAKLIGQKIAESTTAQELINRIKEVVRRRRLTTPPVSGPGAQLDTNTVAEYIDSLLPPDQLAQVEEVCLESDVYLAEIAACHQILTVILSEPALVPPTARQRMYSLVKGREAIPYRKAAPEKTGDGVLGELPRDSDESDEALLLGLPMYPGQGSWFRRLAPVVGVLLLVAAVVGALRFAVGPWSTQPTSPTIVQAPPPPEPATQPATTSTDKTKGKGSGTEDAAITPDVKDTKPAEANKTNPPPVKQPDTQPDSPGDENPSPAPNRVEQRVEVGQAETGKPYILVHRANDQAPWQRILPEQPVFATDTLMSLPGYRSDIRLKRGVQLRLQGSLPEGNSLPLLGLLESQAVIHDTPEVDLDVTLERGRIVITNRKPEGEAHVRLRFGEEVWDMPSDEKGGTETQPTPERRRFEHVWDLKLLDKGTEVAVQLMTGFPPGVPFNRKGTTKEDAPMSDLSLYVSEGEANLKVQYVTILVRQPPGFAWYRWDNVRGPSRIAMKVTVMPPWIKTRPQLAAPMVTALENLTGRLISKDKPLNAGLPDTLKDSEPSGRILGMYCLAATDDLGHLLEALSGETSPDVRFHWVLAVRQWMGRRSENDLKLFGTLKEKYGERQAESIMELLHSFAGDQLGEAVTYEKLIDSLRHENLSIRVLASWNLTTLSSTRDIAKTIRYDPLAGKDQRETAVAAWKKQIPEGEVPPTVAKTKKSPGAS